jgi:hypothetical protein
MQFIEQWLSGLGLDYIVPKLKDNGITNPKKMAVLTMQDMHDVCKLPYMYMYTISYSLIDILVGIEDAEDRKKLYYLIQRLVMVG